MDVITAEALMDMALPLLFYFAVGTLGAFTKDLYETMVKRTEKIRLGEILVGGVVTAIICYGLADTIFKDFSLNTMFLVTFTIGVLGFEIFGNMTNIAKIRNLLLVVDEVRKGIPPNETSGTTVDTPTPTPPDPIIDNGQDIQNDIDTTMRPENETDGIEDSSRDTYNDPV